MHRPRSNAILSALLLVALGAAWLAFAPLQFGGQAAYVIVSGNSMEPVFHRGDLAILRAAADYQVGDIVTYRHPTIGPVIHRIIAEDGDRFTFKGDHNTWTDAYRPSRAELIGKLWLYVPSAGLIVEQLHTPQHLAILAAVMGVIVMTTGTSSLEPRRWRRIRRSGRRAARSTGFLDASQGDLQFALAALAFASLLLGALAFSRPTTRTSVDDIGYQQIGAFGYSSAVAPGVYDTSAVQTGEPIFRRLTNTVAVSFAYHLIADQAAASGTYRLAAEISDASGWKRTIELRPETAFAGNSFNAAGQLDLAAIDKLTGQFERQTGVQNPQYTLAVVPYVALKGTLAGQELRDEFAPRLEFRFDRLALRLVQDGDRAREALAPTQKGLLKRTRWEPNTIALLGLGLEVATARRLALVGVTIGVDGILLLALLSFRAGRRSVAARIRARYGSRLIEVRDPLPQPGDRAIAVARIEDLVKIAERTDRIILHAARGACHCYAVQDGEVTYCYQVAEDPAGATLAEQPL